MKPVSRADERKLFDGLKKVFRKLVNDYIHGDHSADSMRKAAREFLDSPEVDRKLRNIVGKMTRTLQRTTASSWREAASKSSNGNLLYKLITNEMQGPVGAMVWQQIAENVAYIKTVPQEWASYITQYAAREALKGKRADEIEAELRAIMPDHMTKNLKCIARTEVAKANAAITQARAEHCGIRAYIWHCVHDERTRPAHSGMNGILVFYNDPPNPEALFGGGAYGNYHAGCTFNCRCFQSPVVDADFLPDIVKVHDHGAIRTISKRQLIKQFGNPAP